MKDHFGDSLFIYGETWTQQVDLDASWVKVRIFDLQTGLKKEFHYSDRFMKSYTILMNDLLNGLLNKEGFLEYLRTYVKAIE